MSKMKKNDTKKLKMKTLDFVNENFTKVAKLFPGCITEIQNSAGNIVSAIDFDKLKQELAGEIVEGPQERYHLNWPGKHEALLAANTPINKTLRPSRNESVEFDSTKNIFIEGDNAEALKIIQNTYLGAIKMIYIDPPYNTGRNLLYKNDYSETSADYLARSGQVDKDGGKLISNLNHSGRFHSDWLSMMYQRLKIAKSLLAEDGALVCAIDENEFGTLSVVLKEIFSGSAWEHTYVSVVHNPRGQQGTNFSYINEYLIFIYPSGSQIIGDKRIEERDVEWSPLRNWGGDSARSDAKNCFYPILVKNGHIVGFGDVSPDSYHPSQNEIDGDITLVYPIDNEGVERKWRYARQSVESIASQLKAQKNKNSKAWEISFGKNFTKHKSVWNDTKYDSSVYGTQLVNALVEGSGFTYPKSLWAVYDPIEAVTGNDPDAIVLDFFAGSATTAHAVMELNAKDGGNRKFIMVQIPEKIDENKEPFKRGLETIAEISKERIRCAGSQILKSEHHPNWNQDIGFRVLKVNATNMKDVYYTPDHLEQNQISLFADNIKDDCSSEDLLFQVLLDWGVDLSLPISKKIFCNQEVFLVDEDAVVACFNRDGQISEDLCKEIASLNPLRVVFCDSGFQSDSVKLNVEQLFTQLSPHSDLKTI